MFLDIALYIILNNKISQGSWEASSVIILNIHLTTAALQRFFFTAQH